MIINYRRIMALPATDFLRLHGPQLESIGFPPSLLPALQRKLASDVFDAGDVFQVGLCVEWSML